MTAAIKITKIIMIKDTLTDTLTSLHTVPPGMRWRVKLAHSIMTLASPAQHFLIISDGGSFTDIIADNVIETATPTYSTECNYGKTPVVPGSTGSVDLVTGAVVINPVYENANLLPRDIVLPAGWQVGSYVPSAQQGDTGTLFMIIEQEPDEIPVPS